MRGRRLSRNARIAARAAIVALAALAAFAPARAQDVGSIISREVSRQTSRQVGGAAQGEAADRIIRPALRVNNEVRASALGADGRLLAVGLEGGALSLWDIDRGREIYRAQSSLRAVSAIAVANGGRAIGLGGADGRVLLVTARGERALAPAGAPITAVAVRRDGADVAAARADGAIVLVAPSAPQSPRRTALGEPIAALAYAPDGRTLLALTAAGRFARIPLDGAGQSSSVDTRAGRIAAAAFAPDGARALAANARGRLVDIDLASGAARELAARAPGPLAAGPQARLLLAADETGRVAMLEAASGARVAQLITTRRGWAVMDHAGRFDGSNDALSDLVWQAGPDAYAIQDFARRYFEPGVLGRYARGEEARLRAAAAVADGVARPPKVEVVIADETPRTVGAPFQVVVLATDMGGGVDSVRLYHNGRLVDRRAMVQTQDLVIDGRRVRAVAFQTLPSGGANSFRGAATSADLIDGVSERRDVRFADTGVRGVQHVIVAGIDRYGGELPSLNFAVADARAVADFFRTAPRGVFAERRVRTLFDAEAGKAATLRALAEAAAASKAEDVIVIFLAGHGFSVSDSEWRFAPSGASLGQIAATTISGADLEAALVGARARRVVLMIDACQSTAAFGAFTDQRDLYRRFFSDLSRTTGLAVFTAARADADAFELTQLGHGAFTYAMLQGLAGGADTPPPDGRVMVAELASYLDRALPAIAYQVEGVQQEGGAFVLGADFDIR